MERRTPRATALAVGALFAAGCLIRENPAFHDTDADTTSTGADDTTTGTTAAFTCPDGQPPRDWYPDADRDGYGDNKVDPVTACEPPGGFIADHTDCKDMIAEVHPGAPEECNGDDDNCDGLVDGGPCGACKLRSTEVYNYWTCRVADGDPGIFWDDADTRCRGLSERTNVRLASFHSQAEYDAIVPDILATLADDEEGIYHAWIGLTKIDAKRTECGTPDDQLDWRWADGSDVDFTPWNPDEPNNDTTLCTCGEPMCPFENCGEARISSAMAIDGWNDIPCDVEFMRGYVCKAVRDPVLFPGP
jgi:hypothetical protein